LRFGALWQPAFVHRRSLSHTTRQRPIRFSEHTRSGRYELCRSIPRKRRFSAQRRCARKSPLISAAELLLTFHTCPRLRLITTQSASTIESCCRESSTTHQLRCYLRSTG